MWNRARMANTTKLTRKIVTPSISKSGNDKRGEEKAQCVTAEAEKPTHKPSTHDPTLEGSTVSVHDIARKTTLTTRTAPKEPFWIATLIPWRYWRCRRR